MRSSEHWLRPSIASALVLLLLAPLAQAMPRQSAQDQQAEPGRPAQTQTQTPPAANQDQTGTPATQRQSNVPNAPNPQQPANQQTAPEQRPGNPAEPVGTAAAPYEQPVGSAVSRPAGAVIAPAKQKRRHTFLIRMGLVVGAAVAIGTVVALSKSSPARPSH